MPYKGQYAPVIAIFDRQKKNGEKMTITGDGKQRRDFIYVKDIVSALIISLKIKSDKVTGGVFNLGSGENYDINEVVKMLGGKYKFIAPRVGDARETLADIETTKNILGWHPKTKLEEWIKKL